MRIHVGPHRSIRLRYADHEDIWTRPELEDVVWIGSEHRGSGQWMLEFWESSCLVTKLIVLCDYADSELTICSTMTCVLYAGELAILSHATGEIVQMRNAHWMAQLVVLNRDAVLLLEGCGYEVFGPEGKTLDTGGFGDWIDEFALDGNTLTAWLDCGSVVKRLLKF